MVQSFFGLHHNSRLQRHNNANSLLVPSEETQRASVPFGELRLAPQIADVCSSTYLKEGPRWRPPQRKRGWEVVQNQAAVRVGWFSDHKVQSPRGQTWGGTEPSRHLSVSQEDLTSHENEAKETTDPRNKLREIIQRRMNVEKKQFGNICLLRVLWGTSNVFIR